MGVLATDILIKSMLEAAIKDYRANMWIVEEIFSDLVSDPLSSPESGWKEVKSACKWFSETDIPVLLQHRIADTPQIPCISIAYAPSGEMIQRTALGDGSKIELFSPERVATSAIQKCTRDFTPLKYTSSNGIVTLPNDLPNTSIIQGQYLVSSISGKAYQIQELIDLNKIRIPNGSKDDFTDCYVAPKYALWNLHKELTFMDVSYTIGCHTQSDPTTTAWLHKIILYSFLRYKEHFLEARGFELSTFRNSELTRNNAFGADNVFSQYITLSGQVEIDWIKFVAPRMEAVSARFTIMDGGKTPDGVNVPPYIPAWSMPEDEFDEQYVFSSDI